MTYKLLNTMLWIAVGAAICLLFWRPWETIIDVSVVKPVSEIKKEIKDVVQPASVKVDSFTAVIKSLEKDNNVMEKNLYAAWKENKRLREKVQVQVTAPAVESSNGTADDYREIIEAMHNGDTLCQQVVNNLHEQLTAKDSVIFQKSIINMSIQKGFDDMVANSLQKDAAMKQLNKKLKWQKLQAWGFKGAAAAAVIFILKNNIK